MNSTGIDVVKRWSSEELLLRAAWFYYKDELTQDEIAKRLSVSRASVGRMLERARRVGLVTINLNTEYLDAFELSAELRRWCRRDGVTPFMVLLATFDVLLAWSVVAAVYVLIGLVASAGQLTRVGGVSTGPRVADEALHPGGDHGLEQRFLGGEVPVHGARPDAG